MNIIIIGGGKVGFSLADVLSKEGHDITVIDKNADVIEKITDSLDVLCIRGNAVSAKTLMEANVDTADVVIAVTASDELNMVVCLVAKQLGAKYSIARIRDPEYAESLNFMQKQLSLDLVINPERQAAQEISRLLRFPLALNIESFAHGRVEMVEFRVDNIPGIIGTPVSLLAPRYEKILFCALQRGDEVIIPNGSTIFRAGDKLYITGDRLSVTEFAKKGINAPERIKSAMMVGGGHISVYLMRILRGMGMMLKLIEKNPEKCRDLTEAFEDVQVICGDGTDQELLDSENLSAFDSLINLTDRDEENIITGLYAASVGVKKVIAKVNRINYMDVLNDLPIDSVISPKQSTANAILRAVRSLSMPESYITEKVYRILNGKVEALEFKASENAAYLDTPISKLGVKKGVLLAVIARGKNIIIPFGGDHIEAGDMVLIVTEAGAIRTLDDAFM